MGVNNIMFFSKSHIYFLSFGVLMLFVYITADFSQYYIPFGDAFFPFAYALLFFLFYRDLIDYSRTFDVVVFSLVCMFVFCFHFFASFQAPNIQRLVEIFFVFSFLYLKSEAKLWIYDKFIKILAVLLFLAIIEYLLIVFGMSFYVGMSIRKANGLYFYQGILNLVPVIFAGSFFRFQFITNEPGMIGCLCAFILIGLNAKEYKKEFIIFTIAGIISFSLAFYVIFGAFCLSKLKPSNFKLLLIPIILYAVFFEPINDLIVDRVVSKTESGSIDNRNSFKMNNLFNEMLHDGQISFGIGERSLLEMKKEYALGYTTGLKHFLMSYGFVGFVLAFIAFSYVFFRYNKLNYSNIVVLMLFWISFYQRDCLIDVHNTVILFSYGLVKNNQMPLLDPPMLGVAKDDS